MKNCRADCQCPNCDPEMAAIMNTNAEQYARYLQMKTTRALAAANMRAASEEDEQLSAMDSFRQSILADLLTTRLVGREPSTSAIHLQPPDPYADDIAKLRSSYR